MENHKNVRFIFGRSFTWPFAKQVNSELFGVNYNVKFTGLNRAIVKSQIEIINK